MRSLRALLSGLVDYAGLFPPAGLAMRPAVREYAAHRRGDDRWMLGRYVVPLARLGELESALAAEAGEGEKPWPLSVLVGGDLEAAAEALAGVAGPSAGFAIEALELKASTAEEVERALGALPPELELYFELPVDGEVEPLVEALSGSRGMAKIRTGGVTPDAFPRPREVRVFLDACRRHGVAFKATAGLHHPIFGRYRLTYEPDSAAAPMYGFVNLFLAAALVHAERLPANEVQALLLDGEPAAFTFDDAGAAWRDRRLSTEELAAARRDFCRSYGSCSFAEPTADLKELDWL